jgi:hypothetical protein
MDEVIAGTYETGLPPSTREWNPGDDPRKLIKINEPHLCDRRIRALVCCPELGRALAGSMEARTIQVWAVQLLVKPPAGHSVGSDLGVAPGFRAALEAGKVGWHQDRQYWKYWTPDSEVFTAWIALSELTQSAGPMRYVRGSHAWGEQAEGSAFFSLELEARRQSGEWQEDAVVLSPGGVAVHQKLTIHGSGPNLEEWPRRSFVVHVRTERSRPEPEATDFYVSHLDDPGYCPMIHTEARQHGPEPLFGCSS